MVIKYVKLASAATLVGLIAITSTTMASDSCLRFDKQVNGKNQMAIVANIMSGTLSRSYGNMYQLTISTQKVTNLLGFNHDKVVIKMGPSNLSTLSTHIANKNPNIALSLGNQAYAFSVSKVESTNMKITYYLSQLTGTKDKAPNYTGLLDIYVPSNETGLTWNCNK